MRAEKARAGAILAVDTSTASMAAAIVSGGEVLAEVQTMAERNHSVHVVSNIKNMLADTGMTENELEAIAVGNGPGSYTGMRIAAAVGKTLAWAWDKPLVGVSSLEALAYGAWQRGTGAAGDSANGGEHWVVPVMDARRGQVYTSAFAMAEGTAWRRWADDGVRLMNVWVDRLEERLRGQAAGTVGSLSLVGDFSLHGTEAERLKRIGEAAGVIVALQPFAQEGRWIAELGRMRLEAGQIENPHAFAPNYTQLTEAEVVWKAKQAGEAKE
ncbi:tRNA (adenosine(37)-N6)-threonylcarbamoyltransferase complex dimerization subunit type 1 TsaB [Paenibacillus arenilitoris]|uniref:tRNA (Adenosine(37)-N6)-threonylcarbamoyltransferase complex dimerization subunit type 1 TsaB n=1 Tax=Paenibacillus arenilitoris TaxID=2772299 RepID=A0A927H8V8_9BACL|nr:tRNA (adenosine(37)-N6)-threonylcarbamoyltransferase complex dimerization subunit type 1 TsaB [Paenibacillus arenilitoris]MBD2871009.1 tRNA (adenosine(37)-N6)-threonylcarbamoyltransferase complex dimerization subunit type 1 TsaB [Paenibacillus arenilitoris]